MRCVSTQLNFFLIGFFWLCTISGQTADVTCRTCSKVFGNEPLWVHANSRPSLCFCSQMGVTIQFCMTVILEIFLRIFSAFINYMVFDSQSQCLTFTKISATIWIVLTTSDTVNAFLRQLELSSAAVMQHCRRAHAKSV